jgi:hypothetical protein
LFKTTFTIRKRRPARKGGHGYNAALLKAISEASEARAQVLVLARVLAGCEGATRKHSWRNVSQDTARYLRFIEAQEYDLSPVEREPAVTSRGSAD